MQAAKARLLHSEPAAGAVGLAMVLQRLQQRGFHVALHLRSLNPHVASIFQVRLYSAWGWKQLGLLWMMHVRCVHAAVMACTPWPAFGGLSVPKRYLLTCVLLLQSQQAGRRGCMARRQPSVLLGAAEPLAGVSSFAYQGTNAHVIAGSIGSTSDIWAPRSQLWHQQRFWYQVRTANCCAVGWRCSF